MFFRYESGRFLELVNYALNPASEDVMEELFQAGSESGECVDPSRTVVCYCGPSFPLLLSII